MVCICFSTSLRNTMPSLTIAATRSRSTPLELNSFDCAKATPMQASSRAAAPKKRFKIKGISGPGRGRKRGVSTNRFAQESFVVHSDTRQTLQFQLDAERGIGVAGAAGNESSRHEPHGPAARTVFETDELIE